MLLERKTTENNIKWPIFFFHQNQAFLCRRICWDHTHTQNLLFGVDSTCYRVFRTIHNTPASLYVREQGSWWGLLCTHAGSGLVSSLYSCHYMIIISRTVLCPTLNDKLPAGRLHMIDLCTSIPSTAYNKIKYSKILDLKEESVYSTQRRR